MNKNLANNLKFNFENSEFTEIFNSKFGSLNLKVQFINYNIRNKNRDSEYSLKTLFSNFLSYTKALISERDSDKQDIIIISRNRFIRSKIEGKEIYKEYLFNTIVDRLEKEKPSIDYRTVIMSSKPSEKLFRKVSFLSNYLNPNVVLKSFLYSIKINRMWHKFFRKNKSKIKSATEINEFFTFRNLMKMSLTSFLVEEVFTCHEPKVVLMNDDCMWTKPQHRKKFTSIVLQSALITEEKRLRATISNDDTLKSDCYIVSGEKYGSEDSIMAHKTIVTGQPRYDNLYNISNKSKKSNILKDSSIPIQNKIILWGTQFHTMNKNEIITSIFSVFESIKNLDGAYLLIKQHPSEKSVHKDIISTISEKLKFYNLKILKKDSDIFTYISICDSFITKFSTTGIEAISVGKPVIVFNSNKQTQRINYVEAGAAYAANDVRELSKVLKHCINNPEDLDPQRKRFVRDYLYLMDGNSSKRAYKAIKEYL